MEIFVKKYLLFHIFFFFWVSNMILSDALILHVLQLQTQQVMMSQIRSNTEYLIHSLYFFAYFVVEIDEKSSLNGGF